MRLEDHRRLIKRLKENGHYFGNQTMWMEKEMYLWYKTMRVLLLD